MFYAANASTFLSHPRPLKLEVVFQLNLYGASFYYIVPSCFYCFCRDNNTGFSVFVVIFPPNAETNTSTPDLQLITSSVQPYNNMDTEGETGHQSLQQGLIAAFI
jgi:hypothetical protein